MNYSTLSEECKRKKIEYSKKYAIENREKSREYKRKYKNKRKQAARELFQEIKISCLICGNTNKCCLEFHHRDPSQKRNLVCRLKDWGYSNKLLLEEIDKCDIICANCHREHHYSGRPYYGNKKGRYVYKIKEESCCSTCGINKWQCLDFHHRNESDKICNIGRMIREGKYSLENVIDEMKKCDIVCVNCHRGIHSKLPF